VLPEGTIVNVPTVNPATGTNAILQFITPTACFDVQLPNDPKVVQETVSYLERYASDIGARGAVGNPVPVNNNQAVLASFGNLNTNPYTDQSDDVLRHDINALKGMGITSSDERIQDRQEVLIARKRARTLLAQATAEKAAAAALNQAAAGVAGVAPGVAAALSAAAQSLSDQAAADQSAGEQLAIESGLKNS
jgi:hypothetical protein